MALTVYPDLFDSNRLLRPILRSHCAFLAARLLLVEPAAPHGRRQEALLHLQLCHRTKDNAQYTRQPDVFATELTARLARIRGPRYRRTGSNRAKIYSKLEILVG